MIKPLRLARVAARAEILVLQREATGLLRRAAYGAVAAVFLLAALAILHVIGYMALRQYGGLGPVPSAAIVLAVDVILAIPFGLLATGTVKDPVLEEARRLRDQSLEQARDSLTLASMAAPITRVASDMGVIRMIGRMLSFTVRRGASVVRR